MTATRKQKKENIKKVDQERLDDALADTFPASDPVVMQQPVTAAPAAPPDVAADVVAQEKKEHAKLAASELKKSRAKD